MSRVLRVVARILNGPDRCDYCTRPARMGTVTLTWSNGVTARRRVCADHHDKVRAEVAADAARPQAVAA